MFRKTLQFYTNKKSGILRLSLFVCLIVSLVNYFAWTEQSHVRYRHYYTKMHSMIFDQKGDISIAAIGSSRTQTMFGAHYWAEEVFDDFKDEHVVYNLSTSQRGKGFHYTVIRDLLSQRKIDKLILHIIDTDKRSDYVIHPWFYLIATHHDIWKSFRHDKREIFERVSANLKVFFKKHTSIIEGFFMNKIFLASPAGANVQEARTMDHLPANPLRPAAIKKLTDKQDWDKFDKLEFEWNLYDRWEIRNTIYIHEIVNLAKSYGTKVDFIYIPKLYEPFIGKDMKAKLETVFDVNLLQVPKKLERKFFPAAYADSGHGSEKGREIYAKLIIASKKRQWLIIQEANERNIKD